ncbi:hypothetical protein [Deinococcus sp. 6GRE01]|uniref:hypothetical protein n=1 Tax=Deinococcus sp. 6GRE01 TaxID=2745873 RepID=UPI001E5D0537|nr:hypothetical protein [Deinococcus sp. 6GRE01]MCD0155986.1 hypothetical protein [Deinococcus sp. 6GRE01]
MGTGHLRPHEIQMILRHRDAGRTVPEIQRLVGRPQITIQAVLGQHRNERPGLGKGRTT